jgi:hypothetical protein
MGFFSNIKNRVRRQASSPVRPNPGNIGGNLGSDFRAPQIEDMRFRGRAPQKQSGLGGLFRKLQEQIKNQSDMGMPANPEGRMYAGGSPGLYAPGGIFNRGGRDRIMPNFGMEQMPQQNLDFLSRLPKNMMPNLDFSNLPQNMRPGFVAGGPIMGAAGKFARSKAAAQRGTNKYFPDEFGNFPPTGIPSLRPGNLQSIYTSSLPDRLRRGTEDFLMGATAGGTLGAAAIGLDGTQTLREPFSKDNVSFMSPEAFGKDMAQLRMDVGAVINLAKNKAVEMGEDINDYVSRARSAYDQQMNQDMENQRMQEIDAQQGMQPFSALLGPDMPLRRPELTEGRTTSDIDDILSSLEKKN